VLEKIVAIGNSLTAGVQSAGIVDEFQLHSYPYQIARQAGKAADFRQPLVAPPGVGEIDTVNNAAYGPLKYVNGQIVRGDPVPGGINGIQALLTNIALPRAYDNLGLPGADLYDILYATGGGLYDAVLRNPFFGNTTALEQARSLNPTLILLWVGNNDVLGSALDGGDPSQITPVDDFRTRYEVILDQLTDIRDSSVVLVVANIPDVSDIPYVNLLDNLIYHSVPVLGINTPVPVVFDTSFNPILFDTLSNLYVPLLSEENLNGDSHILLPFISEYFTTGLGIPDSTAMAGYGVPAGIITRVLQQLTAAGLETGGRPIPGSLTLTEAEKMTIEDAVAGYNQVIGELAAPRVIRIVNISSMLMQLNTMGVDGFSGKFVFFDPVNTAFSLDGVHPNNGGYALIANEFIKALNELPEVSLSLIDAGQYRGQYSGMQARTVSPEAVKQVKTFFIK
jgi:lysophospholipase L1-like esterase